MKTQTIDLIAMLLKNYSVVVDLLLFYDLKTKTIYEKTGNGPICPSFDDIVVFSCNTLAPTRGPL